MEERIILSKSQGRQIGEWEIKKERKKQVRDSERVGLPRASARAEREEKGRERKKEVRER